MKVEKVVNLWCEDKYRKYTIFNGNGMWEKLGVYINIFGKGLMELF